jgi:hypothetical protein
MGSGKTAFLVGGLALCVFGVWLGREGRRAASWPTTEGTVVYSEVVELPRSLDDRRRFGETRPQQAEVRYSYTVDGHTYRGKGIAMSTGLLPFWEDVLARRIRDRYAVGDRVTVYYDPADPRLAVLEPGASIESRLALLAGAVLVGAAVLLALRSR